MKYDFPDIIPSEAHLWASFIPSRSPEFRVHKTEGLCNTALSQRGTCEPFAKYKLENDHWVKKFEYSPSDTCRCGNKYGGGYYRNGRMLPGDRLWKGDLPVCDQCVDDYRNRNRGY